MSRRNSDSPPFLPLLVTGIAGVASFNAFRYLRRKYPGQVIGLRRKDNWRLSGEGVVACDLTDRTELRRLVERHRFAAVLNGEGSCKLRSCELDPPRAWRLNVEGPTSLLEVIGDVPLRLVHMSIDLVFSGAKQGDYLETDPTDPVTVYGQTMAAAEQVVLARRPDACIVRISLPMGVSFSGHAGAIDWIQSRFKNDKPATLYTDEVRTPTYTDCLNHLWETLLGNRLSGIYHAGGPRRLTLYQIAQIVNRIGGYDPRHLIGCLRHEAGPIPPRAGDVSMNSDKLIAALGYSPFDPWPLCEEHVPNDPRWHFERPTGEPGSPTFLAEVLYRNPARRRAAATTGGGLQ